MKYLDHFQIVRLQDYLLKKSPKIISQEYVNFMVLSRTGMRVSEYVDLVHAQVNTLSQEIRTKTLKRTGHYRTISVDPALAALLSKWKGISRSAYVGGGVTRQAINAQCEKWSKDLGFKITPHMFRHTYAINLLRTTQNIRFVQKQLGHADMSTTSRYLEFVEYDQEISKLGGLYK